MKRINERVWEMFGIYGRVCESCSGAIALSLLQALAMFGCLEKRAVGGLTLYCILILIAVVATVGFFASLISIGRAIHIQTKGHKVAEYLISCVFYPVVIGIILTAVATLKSVV
ncbi:hypothetical protein MXM31_05250 [Klebsiella aerogenes]|uniref:hypothetical protein n=1 Tax=Klebsiella aerogenes TaxID=548 RepID=UPI002DBE08FF|nr:hypothetical protein [Klebsiella aerogenes]MEB5695591.1 hypothetical protein [Klebsiella aerogenes]